MFKHMYIDAVVIYTRGSYEGRLVSKLTLVVTEVVT